TACRIRVPDPRTSTRPAARRAEIADGRLGGGHAMLAHGGPLRGGVMKLVHPLLLALGFLFPALAGAQGSDCLQNTIAIGEVVDDAVPGPSASRSASTTYVAGTVRFMSWGDTIGVSIGYSFGGSGTTVNDRLALLGGPPGVPVEL